MQLTVLIVLVATLAATEVTQGAAGASAAKLIAVLASMSIVVVSAWGISAGTVADVESGNVPRRRCHDRLKFGMRLHVILWFASCMLVLTVLDWPQLMLGDGALGKQSEFCGELAVLGPILLPIILSWAAFYDADECLEDKASSLTRASYVVARVRVFILPSLLPILLVVAFSDLLDHFLPLVSRSSWSGPIRGIPLLAVSLAYPSMLRRVWDTGPMEEASVRARLLEISQQAGLRLHDVLVWRTGGKVVNAALCGFIPKWRLVLLSDGLLDLLSSDQVELVFLHELGHVRRRHSLRLLLGLSSGLVAAGVVNFMLYRSLADDDLYQATSLVVPPWCAAAGVVSLTLLLFSRFARSLELEADAWAVERSASSGSRRKRQDVVRDYVEMLRRLAAGTESRSSDGWLHPSVDERQHYLRCHGPEYTAWLKRRVRTLECVLIALPWSLAALLLIFLC